MRGRCLLVSADVLGQQGGIHPDMFGEFSRRAQTRYDPSLQLFWDKFKGDASEAAVVRAFKVAVIYGLVAILPVLWLTFSAIDISMIMVFTWLVYGILQAFIATLVFTRMIP